MVAGAERRSSLRARDLHGSRAAVESELFGLTTQVPGVETVAVPGRAPAGRGTIRFVGRSYDRGELDLNPYELGLLEVLRDFDRAKQEWDLATRQRWHRLRERLGPKVAV